MWDVAIVGGGFAGALLAYHLDDTARVALVERTPPPGRGVAYGSHDPLHLLNVPAGEMSALSDDPGHFVRWLRARGVAAEPGDFIARGLYGEYMGELVAGRATVVADEAVGLLPEGGGFRLRLASGEVLQARQVVLAVGGGRPAPLRVADGLGPSYVADPWSPEAVAPVSGAVLLVGAGLTAVDVAIALAERTDARRIELVSRRARLPAAQRLVPPYRDWLDPATATPRISWLMHRLRAEIATGADWRAVVDALRPHVPALWQRLPLVERRRFLRHARSAWEAHRNRLPPPSAERLEALEAAGRLGVHAARLARLEPMPDGLRATLVSSGGETTLDVARVINCTGPDLGYRRMAPRVIQDALGTGLARLDPLGLGLDVGPDFRLYDEDGYPTSGLYALGAPAKGRFWEVMAVAELREQALSLSRRLRG